MVVGIVTGIIIPGNVMLRTKRIHSFYVLTMKVHIIPVVSYGCEYHNRYHTLGINSTVGKECPRTALSSGNRLAYIVAWAASHL